MTTITKSYGQTQMSSQTYSNSNSLSLINRYNKIIDDLKFSHFGLISMAILIGSIMGGTAAMFVFEAGAPLWEFIVGLTFTMANLVASIAQAPTKWVFNLFILSLIVNSTLIVVNMF